MNLQDRLQNWGRLNGFGYYSPEIVDLVNIADDPELVINWMEANGVDRNAKAGASLEEAIQYAADEQELKRLAKSPFLDQRVGVKQ